MNGVLCDTVRFVSSVCLGVSRAYTTHRCRCVVYAVHACCFGAIGGLLFHSFPFPLYASISVALMSKDELKVYRSLLRSGDCRPYCTLLPHWQQSADRVLCFFAALEDTEPLIRLRKKHPPMPGAVTLLTVAQPQQCRNRSLLPFEGVLPSSH